MLYHVRYVEGCGPKIKSFKTKDEAGKFVANFMLKHQFKNTDDNWIESIYLGEHIYLEPSLEVTGVKNGSSR